MRVCEICRAFCSPLERAALAGRQDAPDQSRANVANAGSLGRLRRRGNDQRTSEMSHDIWSHLCQFTSYHRLTHLKVRYIPRSSNGFNHILGEGSVSEQVQASGSTCASWKFWNVLQSIAMSVSLRLSACLSQKWHVHTKRNFLYALPVAVAQSISDISVILYVLPFCGWHRACQ